MLDYELYNVHPGQQYARADDPLQVPTLEVINVLDYALAGDCTVKELNGPKLEAKDRPVKDSPLKPLALRSRPPRIFTIDCFKLSNVRYNLIST